MLKKFLSDAVQTVAAVKTATPQTNKNRKLKLHRIASEPYSVQARRLQDIHRTLSDSTHCSYSREDKLSENEEGEEGMLRLQQKKVLPRRSSLRKRDSSKVQHCKDDHDHDDSSRGEKEGEGEGARKKKSVTWIDDKIPGRSISEFHLITPRSFASARENSMNQMNSSFSNQPRSVSLSLRANQQLQYYYYHQQASRSPRACQSCLTSLRSFWWGL